MFDEYFFATLFLVFGLINVIWPHKTVKITWAVRHGIDEDGEKSLTNGMRFFGFVCLFFFIIWLFQQFD